VKTPTWTQIERFCEIDGWSEARRSGHVFFEKVLADGTVLQTHRSHASRKTMSPGRFRAILRYQLQVSEAQLWLALQSRQPIDRTAGR